MAPGVAGKPRPPGYTENPGLALAASQCPPSLGKAGRIAQPHAALGTPTPQGFLQEFLQGNSKGPDPAGVELVQLWLSHPVPSGSFPRSTHSGLRRPGLGSFSPFFGAEFEAFGFPRKPHPRACAQVGTVSWEPAEAFPTPFPRGWQSTRSGGGAWISPRFPGGEPGSIPGCWLAEAGVGAASPSSSFPFGVQGLELLWGWK